MRTARTVTAVLAALTMAATLAIATGPANAEHASGPTGAARTDAKRVALGHGTACVILDNGQARCWGNNNVGQTGTGVNRTPLGRDESPDTLPTVGIEAERTITEIDSGQYATCALLDNASVRCWGGSNEGVRGVPGGPGRIGDDELPTVIPPVTLGGTPTAIAAGYFSNCALLTTGDMRCWGSGSSGLLGTGNSTDIGDDETPASIPAVDLGPPATALTVGRFHGCAILNDGSVRCWGGGSALPTGGVSGGVPTGNPSFLLGGKKATAISAGNNATCALNEDQDVYCWGNGDAAQLSTGTNTTIKDPTKVDLGSRKIVALDLGDAHACVVDTAGAVLCWGESSNGRLGYGNLDDIGDDEPPTSGGSIDVGGRAVKAVSAGFKGTCVVLDNDTVRCWGDAAEIGSGQPLDIGDDEKPTAIPPVNYVGTATFKALDKPARILETRAGEPGPAPVQGKGIVAANGRIDVQVAGVGGVPDKNVYAVVLNVTIAASTNRGFVTAWPKGTAQPTASNINVTGPGQTAPNSVIVPISADGQISIFTKGGGHLVADVFGYFESAASARAGRLIGVSPARVFDTRPSESAPGPKGKLPANGTIEVKVTGANDVPNSGVSAVVLNVTATQATDRGFITVFPGNVARPDTSNINLAGPGATRPNTVIVPVSPTGTVKFFTQKGAHLLADISGYFTDATAVDTDDGLFVRINPSRLLDSRSPNPTPIPPGGTTSFAVTGRLGIPSTANAVALNFTGTDALDRGFVTAWPSDQAQGDTSSLNIPAAGETIANLGVIPLTMPSGRVSLFTQKGANLIADTSGYFL